MKLTKYAKYLGVAALAIGLATGCQSSGNMNKSNASDQAVQKIISDAKAELKIAKKGNYAWRDTGKFIKKAEKALAAGDTKKATSLATKALEQSKMAKLQSVEQAKAVKARFN